MTTLAPDAAPRTRPGLTSVDGRAYPLEQVRVSAHAEGGHARTTLRQRFANPHQEALEVLYTLPLPADGAVTVYRIRMGETVIHGEVEARDRAAQRYREALYEGRTAGLLEQDRADTFQQSLGNLPSGVPVEVEIDVLHPLCFLPADGEAGARWEYRFPTVVGVRYHGAPGRVPDAGRLEPDRVGAGELPVRAELEAVLADAPSAGEAAAVECPSHGVVVEDGGEGLVARFAEPQPLDRDVVLRWRAASPEVGVRVVEGPGLEGDEGRYALVTVVPPAEPRATFRRDVTVLLDASGSMRGDPLRHAKTVVNGLLDGLTPDDRFEILAFSNQARRLTPNPLTPAEPTAVEEARQRLAALRADGGTEMASALRAALEPMEPGSQRQVVLVTDGYVGFESEVVREATHGSRGVRVHAVGIGTTPNRTLLHGLSHATGGEELAAGDEATAREAARRLTAATAEPVLTDLRLGGSAVRGRAPARPMDVLAGRPAIFTVELHPHGGQLTLQGAWPDRDEPWAWNASVAPTEARSTDERTSLPVGALHGRGLLQDLELELASLGLASGRPQERDEVLQEIRRVGLRHRITSRETSLVAVADEPTADPREPRRRRRLEVELPAGVSAEGVGLVAEGAVARDARPSYSAPAKPLADEASLARFEGDSEGELEQADADAALDDAAVEPGGPAHSFVPRDRTRRRKRDRPSSRDDKVTVVEATAVEVDGATLTLEVEVPEDGFRVVAGSVRVERPDGTWVPGTIAPDRSSPEGPHAAGLLLRLVVRVRGESLLRGLAGRVRVELPTSSSHGRRR